MSQITSISTLDRVAAILVEHCPGLHIGQITPGARLGEISTDDGEWAGILAAIEEVYFITIDQDGEIPAVLTIGELVELIDAKRTAEAA
jgi:hypothetical protein